MENQSPGQDQESGQDTIAAPEQREKCVPESYAELLEEWSFPLKNTSVRLVRCLNR